MKNRIITILSCILIGTISLFGQSKSLHSDKNYVSNPELARQDALNYAHKGNFPEAILCYKKYALLTGKDMTAEISKLEREQYPSWYDAFTMLAIPMSDGSVLIVDKTLRSSPAWELHKITIVESITDYWFKSVSQEEFKAIQQAGLYIPESGLFHTSSVGENSSPEKIIIKRGDRVVRTERIPNESKSLTVHTMTANGEKKLDCGSYTKKGQWNGKRVMLTNSDNRRNYNIYFYPNRKIRYVNGSWQFEK